MRMHLNASACTCLSLLRRVSLTRKAFKAAVIHARCRLVEQEGVGTVLCLQQGKLLCVMFAMS